MNSVRIRWWRRLGWWKSEPQEEGGDGIPEAGNWKGLMNRVDAIKAEEWWEDMKNMSEAGRTVGEEIWQDREGNEVQSDQVRMVYST